MLHLFVIFRDILLPVFVLIFIGVILQRKFQLDLNTLTKISIYYLSPALIFTKLYESTFSPTVFFGVIFFTLLFIAVMFGISTFSARMLKLSRPKKMSFTNSVIFYNSANFGIPVNDLVFKHDPFAASIQIVVMAIQNTLVFTYGVISLKSVTTGVLKALLDYFKMPLFYALVLGIAFNIFDISLPQFLTTPITYISNALIAIVLLTLGAQIAHIKISFSDLSIYISMFFRLLLGPFIALLFLKIAGLEGVLAQALLISTAMPTAVNTSIIAQEYNNEPEFAAKTVILSTLFSSLTLSFIIFIALHIF